MNRFRAYYPIDDAPQSEGDGVFAGVNALLDPAQLGETEVAGAVNMRFDHGRAETRKGIRIMPWGARGEPGDGPSIIRPYGQVAVAETYQDPIAGTEWMVIVAEVDGDWHSYRTRPGSKGFLLPVTAGESLDTATDIIQTYNGLVLLRGPDAAPLYLRSVDEGWRTLPDPTGSGAFQEAIPPSSVGIYFQNRLCVIDQRPGAQYADTVWVSDLGGVASVLEGNRIYQSFKINQGSADRLTALAKFNETTLVCAKERSIYVVSDIFGDNETVANNARLNEVTRQYGCLAPRSWVQVGADLWFLGHRRGICSLRQTEVNAIQGVDVPVSRAIQPIIDRINWEHAAGVVAAAHDNRVYFAVPLDNSTRNNAILVYSTLTQAWAGYDESDATDVVDFVKFTYAGAVRLGFTTSSGFICLYEDGYTDHTGTTDGIITYNPISSILSTRAYGGRSAGIKRFTRIKARVKTSNPSYSIKADTDGPGEVTTVGLVTKDPTRYTRPAGKPSWNPDNSNGDWADAYREDYAAIAPGLQVTDGPTGAGTVAWDALQETEETFWLSQIMGQSAQLHFINTRGRIELAGLRVDMIRGYDRDGPTT